MCKVSVNTIAAVIIYGILLVHADDSEDSSEEDGSPPVSGLNCPNTPQYCRTRPPANRIVCGTNGVTYISWCWLRQDACARGGSWKVAYRGECRRPPVPRPRPTTTTKAPTTMRTTTTRQTTTPLSTEALAGQPTTSATAPPTTSATAPPTTSVQTTRTVTCPTTCDLVFDPLCTTVGTYQNECAFDAVKCLGIISQDETILFRGGYCPTTPVSGP